MAGINPYLNFNGNCEDAFNFYKSVFGGEFKELVRFNDMPTDHPMPEAAGKQIMHVSLPIGETSLLMASDAPEGFGPPLVTGNNFSVSIGADSKEEADKLFNGLASGGEVTMPLETAPWGSYFGMLTDKFGISWLMSFDDPQRQQ